MGERGRNVLTEAAVLEFLACVVLYLGHSYLRRNCALNSGDLDHWKRKGFVLRGIIYLWCMITELGCECVMEMPFVFTVVASSDLLWLERVNWGPECADLVNSPTRQAHSSQFQLSPVGG